MSVVIIFGLIIAVIFVLLTEYRWELNGQRQRFSLSTKRMFDKSWTERWQIPLADIASFEAKSIETYDSSISQDDVNHSKTCFTVASLKNGEQKRLDQYEGKLKINSNIDVVNNANRKKLNNALNNNSDALIIFNKRAGLRAILIILFLIPITLLFAGIIK